MANLWLREHRLVRCNGNVGRELVPEAAAHGPAVDLGDDRLPQPPHMGPLTDPAGVVTLPELDELRVRLALRVGMPGAALSGLALVVAGAEGAAGAGEDDDADSAVGIGLIERAMQLGFERRRQSVHPLRPVERDGRNALLDAVEQLLARLLAHLFARAFAC